MRRAVLVAIAICVPASVSAAADNPFVGNTLRAVFQFDYQACSASGECQPAQQNSQMTVHVYFGTKGNVFDYGKKAGTGDFLMRLNKPSLTKVRMGEFNVQIEQTWSVRGNVATFRLVSQGAESIQANLATFTVTGGRCVANLTWIRPGIRHLATFSRRECSLTPGQVEP